MRFNLYNDFLNTVSDYPDKTAIYDNDSSISFSQLKDRESLIAEKVYLVNGNKNRTPVGVFLPKCIDSIAADIGIIHSGNFYMNLDVKNPEERLKNILDLVKPSCIVTSNK